MLNLFFPKLKLVIIDFSNRADQEYVFIGMNIKLLYALESLHAAPVVHYTAQQLPAAGARGDFFSRVSSLILVSFIMTELFLKNCEILKMLGMCAVMLVELVLIAIQVIYIYINIHMYKILVTIRKINVVIC